MAELEAIDALELVVRDLWRQPHLANDTSLVLLSMYLRLSTPRQIIYGIALFYAL